MSDVHIYRANSQPAHRFRVHVGGLRAHWIRHNPRMVGQCDRCGRRRWLSKLRVQVYYDMVRQFCAETCERGRG